MSMSTNYVEDEDRSLLGIEIARYNEKEFLYQAWENDDRVEVDVVAESYLDSDIDEHVEKTRVEGTVNEIAEDMYEWTPEGNRDPNTVVSVVSYDDDFQPATRELEDLDEASDLERLLETSFNGEPLKK